MMSKISEEKIQKAIRLYKNKDLTIREISNLCGISVSKLNIIYRECFANGKLKARSEARALKKRTPNGMGKGRYIKKGYHSVNGKYTEEQEKQIAIDYYEKDMTNKQLKEKWNVHPVQMQRIRNKYRSIYGFKKNAPPSYVEKYKNSVDKK